MANDRMYLVCTSCCKLFAKNSKNSREYEECIKDNGLCLGYCGGENRIMLASRLEDEFYTSIDIDKKINTFFEEHAFCNCMGIILKKRDNIQIKYESP